MALCFVCLAAACGGEKQPAAGGNDGGSSVIESSGGESGEGGESQSEQQQGPAPAGEGNAYKLCELQFYLPTAFIASKSNTETGNQRYYTVEDGSLGSGTVITVMIHDNYDGLDLGNYANSQSLASISRTKMYSNGFNGCEWYTGEWGAVNQYYFVGAKEMANISL